MNPHQCNGEQCTTRWHQHAMQQMAAPLCAFLVLPQLCTPGHASIALHTWACRHRAAQASPQCNSMQRSSVTQICPMMPSAQLCTAPAAGTDPHRAGLCTGLCSCKLHHKSVQRCARSLGAEPCPHWGTFTATQAPTSCAGSRPPQNRETFCDKRCIPSEKKVIWASGLRLY